VYAGKEEKVAHGWATRLTIDKNNLVHSTTDARGITRNYVYDAQKRLRTKTYSDGSPTAHFRYRSSKNPIFLAYVGEKNGQDLQKLERYNKAGALDGTLQKYLDGFYSTVRVAYGAHGHITRIIYPDGRQLRQAWNHKGQLTAIKHGDLALFGDTQYANADDLLSASLGERLALKKAYDSLGRLAELSVLSGTQVLFGHRYHYNAYGSVERLDDLSGTNVTHFTYDQLNRVSIFKDSEGTTRSFSYDADGNLENASDADGTLAVDAQNRLQSATGFSYDAAGEMTFDGKHKYAYNTEDRIESVDSGKVRYIYNAMGELIERLSPKGSEKFVWLNGQLLAQQETDGTWTDFLYINGQRIASIHKPLPTEKNPKPKDEVTYFVADRVGLARAAVTAKGVVAAAVFTPFGKPLTDTPLAAAAEAISYSGELYDPYTGLDIYQYRSYNPRLGRWMSPDPSGLHYADLTNPQSFNLYTFVTNDPLKYFDAHGLYEEYDDGDGSDIDDFYVAQLADDGDGGPEVGGGGGGGGDGQQTCCTVPPVTPVDLGCPSCVGPPPSPPDPTNVDLGCDYCTGTSPDPTGYDPGDPSSGDPYSGDPGSGDPGNGDPGNGDPGSSGSDPYDPGSYGPSPDPCAFGACSSPDPNDPGAIDQSTAEQERKAAERLLQAQMAANRAYYVAQNARLQPGDVAANLIIKLTTSTEGNTDPTYTLSGQGINPYTNPPQPYTYYIWEHQTQQISASQPGSINPNDFITPPPGAPSRGNVFPDFLHGYLDTYRYFTISTKSVYDPTAQIPVNIQENGQIVGFEHIYSQGGPVFINGSTRLKP
jgi:RHS repeat-associated protein